MKVTLKKAAELSRALIAASKAIEVATSIKVSSYGTDDVVLAVEVARGAFHTSMYHALAVLHAAYDIRQVVAAANTKYGVDKMLTDIALLDEKLARLNALSTEGATDDQFGNQTSSDDEQALRAKIAHMRNEITQGESRRFMTTENTIVSIIDSETRSLLAADIATLKRERAMIKDRITAINFAKMVEIPEGPAGHCQGQGLV